MDLSALDDIHDPQALRALLISLRAQHEVALATISQQSDLIATRERTISRRDTQIEVLTAEIARLRRLQFSARSERMDPAQRELFEETMAADIAAVEAQLSAIQAEGESEAAAQVRRKAHSAGRQALPEHLRRVETRHDPADDHCPQCQDKLIAIGEHVSERLAIEPLRPATAG